MDFVTPLLAIGTCGDAADTAACAKHGIGTVISLMTVDFTAGNHHLTLPVTDRQPLAPATIRRATALIHREVSAGRKVLLHCQMGISRSPALAACYLHEYAGYSLDAAIAQIRSVRSIAEPHPVLLTSISTHYAATSRNAQAEVDLSANENPLGPSPRAIAAMQAVLPHSHRYPDRHGQTLRASIAATTGCTEEQVILGNGSCELLDLAARAFLAPGDNAVLATPSFNPYRSAISKAHGQAIAVPIYGFSHDLTGMAAHISAHTGLVFVGNPNNPTGTGCSTAELRALLDHLPPRAVLLLDEAYRNYAPPDSAALANGEELVAAGYPVLVVRTFSKLHGLAGLRIGYALGPPHLIQQMEALRPHYNTSAPAQAAALAALGDREHAETSRALAEHGRAQLTAGCAVLGLPCTTSHANFLLVRTGFADGWTTALAARGVRVKSGTPFGLPEHLRITVGLPEENRRCLDALADVQAQILSPASSPRSNGITPARPVGTKLQGDNTW